MNDQSIELIVNLRQANRSISRQLSHIAQEEEKCIKLIQKSPASVQLSLKKNLLDYKHQKEKLFRFRTRIDTLIVECRLKESLAKTQHHIAELNREMIASGLVKPDLPQGSLLKLDIQFIKVCLKRSIQYGLNEFINYLMVGLLSVS
jgi:hypothetical protein